jgi:ubiquinone/menaquinone biosynthesis C-methylase UbiE
VSIRVCPWCLAFTFDNPLRTWTHNPKRLFAPFLEPGARALDLGCGLGWASLAMARLVGPTGLVYAVDAQARMLNTLRHRAKRAGVLDRIRPMEGSASDFSLASSVDFAVAFWVLHEVPDQAALFARVRDHLADRGRFLVVEPRGHVTDEAFGESVETARQHGFHVDAEPVIAWSRAVLLKPEERKNV